MSEAVNIEAGGEKGVGGSTDGRGRGLTLGLGLEVGEGGAAEGKGGLRRDVPGIQTMQPVWLPACAALLNSRRPMLPVFVWCRSGCGNRVGSGGLLCVAWRLL